MHVAIFTTSRQDSKGGSQGDPSRRQRQAVSGAHDPNAAKTALDYPKKGTPFLTGLDPIHKIAAVFLTAGPIMARWCEPLIVALFAAAAVPAAAQEHKEALAFISVKADDETRKADQRLTERLQQRAGVRFTPEELDYEGVIERLVRWRKADGSFLARTTPYVYIVAEMLGADIEPLATYVSTDRGTTTYRSYLVVKGENLPPVPSLEDVVQFVKQKQPRRFVYHNQFSTSSYLFPLLFFRSHDIFQMTEPESSEGLTFIRSERQDVGSSKLVDLVATGKADIAAVWDNTKSRVAPAVSNRVHFVPLPTAIPNDLLVCPGSMDLQSKKKLLDAIDAMNPTEMGPTGDFATWQSYLKADSARHALAELRWNARERPPGVTVDVVVKPGSPPEMAADLLEAGRQAVRLAGTEFVLYDGDHHKHRDFTWTLEPLHDSAIKLTSAITGYNEENGTRAANQEFRLSFRDVEDLTNRLVSIIQSRMHRIRYVWPFSGTDPIVLRDIPLSLPPGAEVMVQAYTWVNPDQNWLTLGKFFPAAIKSVNRYRFELDSKDFITGTGAPPKLDPMSNVGYRVILVRAEEDRALFRMLTIALVLAFVLAGIAAGWDALRLTRRPIVKSAPQRVEVERV